MSALGLIALAALAVVENRREHHPPRWAAANFVLMRGVAEPAAPSPGWIVAVNPRCPHCVASISSVMTRAARETTGPRLRVLIVDQARRPGADELALIPAAEVWWDSSGVWRRRWHRTDYGEVLVFDAAGSFLHVLPMSTP